MEQACQNGTYDFQHIKNPHFNLTTSKVNQFQSWTGYNNLTFWHFSLKIRRDLSLLKSTAHLLIQIFKFRFVHPSTSVTKNLLIRNTDAEFSFQSTFLTRKFKFKYISIQLIKSFCVLPLPAAIGFRVKFHPSVPFSRKRARSIFGLVRAQISIRATGNCVAFYSAHRGPWIGVINWRQCKHFGRHFVRRRPQIFQ